MRCSYCMGEDVAFVPKNELLSLEEIDKLCSMFIRLGVRKLRLTGGEPLLRRNVMTLISGLGRHLAQGTLDELTMTTNGARLKYFAGGLRDAGIRRINVSLDTLSADIFRNITRVGNLSQVLEGIHAAQEAGLSVKINTVALKGVNEECFDSLIAWCGQRKIDMTLIEVMPMGEVDIQRSDQYLPLMAVRKRLEQRWTLLPDSYRSGGPARYVTVAETGGRLGFITPMTHGYCGSCNRVRMTASGMFYPCLGHDSGVDLLAMLRAGDSDQGLEQMVLQAIYDKPNGHSFVSDGWQPLSTPTRRMNATGG